MSPRPVELSDLFAIKTIADPQLSPDGGRVAYTLSTIDAEADEYRTSIWVAPTNGGEPLQFTRGPKRDHSPRWSPDGQRLAFLSDRDGEQAQLYLMPAHGGEARKLTSLENGAGAAVWSPDNQRILFAARVLKESPPKEAEARKRWAQRPKHITRAQFKADGQGYIFDANSQLFVVEAASGATTQITQGDWEDRAPAWSPDGAQIAFSRTREGSSDYNISDIWVANADGSNARRITENVGRATSPSWSNDGKVIACYGGDEQMRGLGESLVRVWLIPLDGSAPRNLTHNYDRGTLLVAPPATTPAPVWSSDDRTLTFVVGDAGNVHVARAAVSDGAVTKVVTGERQAVSASAAPAAQRIAFVATQHDNPNDVYVCDWDGGHEQRLTRVNEALLSEIVLPRVERRTFTDPHGSGALDGWVVRAADARGATPLLVDIHGGPHSYHGNNFMLGYFYRYVLAMQGWTVLLLNPTGSGSYGRAFANGIRGRWGEYDLPQHHAAIDTLIADGLVDGDRLAVTGYSYGGFMTSWTIGHTERFKAAIVGAPVVNFESFYGTSDIGVWFSEWEINQDYFADRAHFRRLSPINYVERVVTPTLILHGESDDRCPIGQGEELFFGLLARGKAPTEFVRYAGGSHLFILNGRPSHRLDYGRRVMAWLAKYVVG